MRIGIDISQLAYPNSGVANYLYNLVLKMIEIDKENTYVLFFSSMRGTLHEKLVKSFMEVGGERVIIKKVSFPPTVLEFLWNTLHRLPIETFVGDLDIFISSDWTEPPTKKAKKATILYDLIVFTFPKETDKKIIDAQKRKLKWVRKESVAVFCISEATKKDAIALLQIPEERLHVLPPGLTL